MKKTLLIASTFVMNAVFSHMAIADATIHHKDVNIALQGTVPPTTGSTLSIAANQGVAHESFDQSHEDFKPVEDDLTVYIPAGSASPSLTLVSADTYTDHDGKPHGVEVMMDGTPLQIGNAVDMSGYESSDGQAKRLPLTFETTGKFSGDYQETVNQKVVLSLAASY